MNAGKSGWYRRRGGVSALYLNGLIIAMVAPFPDHFKWASFSGKSGRAWTRAGAMAKARCAL